MQEHSTARFAPDERRALARLLDTAANALADNRLDVPASYDLRGSLIGSLKISSMDLAIGGRGEAIDQTAAQLRLYVERYAADSRRRALQRFHASQHEVMPQ